MGFQCQLCHCLTRASDLPSLCLGFPTSHFQLHGQEHLQGAFGHGAGGPVSSQLLQHRARVPLQHFHRATHLGQGCQPITVIALRAAPGLRHGLAFPGAGTYLKGL